MRCCMLHFKRFGNCFAVFRASRAFTRRFQRLLGFGDVAATRQDLKAACDQEDTAELNAIAPEAAAFIKARASDLSIVPAVCEGLRSGLPSLQDCAKYDQSLAWSH